MAARALLQLLLRAAALLGLRLAAAYPLNETCSPPKALGGTGTCGPAFCGLIQSTDPTCVFANSNASTPNYAATVASLACRVCTPRADARCSAARLRALHGFPGSGVKAAFCNDNWLVLVSSGEPGFTPNLLDVPWPPASVSLDGTRCVTRSTSMGTLFWRIYLGASLLPTATRYNNVNSVAFPGGAGDAGYLSSPTNGVYGLPTRGAVGVSISGQDIFPLYNNRAEGTLQACEVDSCNEHVGGGGGQPHLHGDPFGATCLYGARNYTTPAGAVDLSVHPPQFGYALDGFSIYGRYLSVAAPGFSTPLDDCGGHDHDGMGYHYHAQVINAFTDAGCVVRSVAVGTPYPAFTPGVYQCFRGNLSSIPTWGINNTNPLQALSTKPCCGTTDYYTAPGITLSLTAGGTSPSPTPSRSTSRSASPTAAASGTATSSASAAASGSATETSSSSAAASPSATPSASGTSAPTETPSATRSASAQPTESSSASGTRSGTPSGSTSVTATATQSATPSASGTSAPTQTPSATPSASARPTESGTPSGTASDTPSGTASDTPAGTASGTASGTPAGTPPGSPSRTSAGSASGTATAAASWSPSLNPSGTPTATPSAASRTKTSISTKSGTKTRSKASLSASRTRTVSRTASISRTRKVKRV